MYLDENDFIGELIKNKFKYNFTKTNIAYTL